MLRLHSHISQLSSSATDCLAQQTKILGLRRCPGSWIPSGRRLKASRAAEKEARANQKPEYKPIKKLLVANRGINTLIVIMALWHEV